MALADELCAALRKGNVLLQAEPGAGKSTALPIALLFNGQIGGRIILLEPRRLAARSVAQRLASHLGEKVGQRVGLRMRSDTRVSDKTQLEVVTEGVLTRMLQSDPALDGVAVVIFDEFHERSLHADLGLALCLEVQQALRDDLRILLMSATLEADQLASQLQPVQRFHCSVRQHPVEISWVGDKRESLPSRIAQVVCMALAEHPGDVLVFLPGVAEINRAASLLQPRLDTGVSLHRLHSGVDVSAQARATEAAKPEHRRVILATSIAETSITIDGVRVVVDSGLERRARTDSSTGAQRLHTVMASQASATQRAGRAGRTAPGVCYRLWSETDHLRRAEHWQPEIIRADLTMLFLDLALWGATGQNDLPWLQPPPMASLARAEDLLRQLNVWQGNRLTAHGKRVAELPVNPRLGHMLVWAAEQGVAKLACQLAVLLDDQQRLHGSVDLEPGLKAPQSKSAAHRSRQLSALLNVRPGTSSSISAAVVLAQAFPDWIAQRRAGEPGRYLLACGAGAVLDAEDPLARCEWLVVAQLGGAGAQARIFAALALDIAELERHSAEKFESIDHLDWDDRQQRVIAEQRVMIGSLIVKSKGLQNISDEDKAKALLIGIRKRGIGVLPWNSESREWQARVNRMRKLAFSTGKGEYPMVDDDSLLDSLHQWLLPWLQGVGSIKSLQQIDLLKVFNGMLDHQQKTLMDECLPRRYQVPSGSSISLSYCQPGNPVLSVRLQEMLGCADNPTIARGRIPLKVELLSPASRPVQVTEDLANFWHNSYPAVKKELAGRYPKHVWPDDPLNAQPTAHAKRRK